MRLDEFEARVSRFCSREALRKPRVTERRITTLKLRIPLDHSFIELYYNEATGTINSALITRGQRMFGINGYPQKRKWHMHPAGEKAIHTEMQRLTIEKILEAHINAAKRLRLI